MINEQQIRAVVRHRIMIETAPLSRRLVLEGIQEDLLKDAVQYLAAASAEYGLGAISMPAAGAGLAVGPTVETVVDSLFAAEDIASTLQGIRNIQEMGGQFADLYKQAINAYNPANLGNFYRVLSTIIQKTLKLAGTTTQAFVTDTADKLREAVESVIAKLVGVIEQGVKIVIPDATIGLAAAKSLSALLMKVNENAFTLAAQGIKRIDILDKFVSDPSIAIGFFEDIIGQVITLMRDASKSLDEMGFFQRAAGASLATVASAGMLAGPAMAVATLGPYGLEKAADALEAQLPNILNVVDMVLNIAVPSMLTCLAIYQILLKRDYLDKEGKAQEQQFQDMFAPHLEAKYRLADILGENLDEWSVHLLDGIGGGASGTSGYNEPVATYQQNPNAMKVGWGTVGPEADEDDGEVLEEDETNEGRIKISRSALKEMIRAEYREFRKARAINESGMKRLAGDIESWVFDFNTGAGAVHVDQLINGWEKDWSGTPIEWLWSILDNMEASGYVQSEGSSGYYRFLE